MRLSKPIQILHRYDVKGFHARISLLMTALFGDHIEIQAEQQNISDDIVRIVVAEFKKELQEKVTKN